MQEVPNYYHIKIFSSLVLLAVEACRELPALIIGWIITTRNQTTLAQLPCSVGPSCGYNEYNPPFAYPCSLESHQLLSWCGLEFQPPYAIRSLP